MDKNTLIRLTNSFDAIVQHISDSDIEFWYARDLQEILAYTEWRNFLKVVGKAKEAAENSGAIAQNHFVDVNKMVKIGSGVERPKSQGVSGMLIPWKSMLRWCR
ncbi:hypothetical protein L2W58_12660 [Dethiosulfovibrio sp. F2B]|uniref:BRO family protein n=1 Tax=Dethiosulfovibrio faecalis TaxID=2720018 RepID=UPI001F157B0B|nr:BRO family protein [Dethiosulfovibrio faecalis]MCF4152649.1 hypothetical protein [Dethiosulfovibrio faecalis]